MPKFILQPFATAGDKTAVPDPVQATGSVSYNQGFGPDYSREQGVDPLAKDVPREQTNQLYFDITDNIGFWQRNGAPVWVTSAENGGSPLAYGAGAIVRYRADPGDPYLTYISRVAGNTTVPTTAASWTLFNYQFAANADTTSTNIPVDPAYVTARLAGVTITVPPASESAPGISQYATDAQTITGTIPNRTVTVTGLAAIASNKEWATPAGTTLVSGRVQLASVSPFTPFSSATLAATPAWVGAAIPQASPTVVGRMRTATPAEANAQALDNVAVPPSGLTGYARLSTNVLFTFVQSVNGFQKTSAEAVKHKLRRNNYGLLSVLRIKTGIGRYRPDYSADQSEHVFMFAGQLKKVIPLAVRSVGATYKGGPIDGIDYDMLVPVLVRAVKQLAGISAISLLATICALAFGG